MSGSIGAPRGTDCFRYVVALGNDCLCLCNGEFASVIVAQNIRFARSQHAEDAIDESVGYGAEGLLVMMALPGHQPEVDLGQIGIDLASRVGGEHEGALDAIVSALRDSLPRSFYATTVRAAREQAAEPADVAFGPETIGAVEQAKQDGREMTTDTGDGAQDIFRLKLSVERFDLAVQFGAGGHVGVYDIDLDGYFQLQLGKVDMSPVEVAGFAGGLAQTLDEGIDKRAAVRVIAAGML